MLKDFWKGTDATEVGVIIPWVGGAFGGAILFIKRGTFVGAGFWFCIVLLLLATWLRSKKEEFKHKAHQDRMKEIIDRGVKTKRSIIP